MNTHPFPKAAGIMDLSELKNPKPEPQLAETISVVTVQVPANAPMMVRMPVISGVTNSGVEFDLTISENGVEFYLAMTDRPTRILGIEMLCNAWLTAVLDPPAPVDADVAAEPEPVPS